MEQVDLTILATGLAFPEGPVWMLDGSLLFVEIPLGRISKLSPEGGLSVLSDCGGGPNGLAVGPDGVLYQCNSGGFVFHTEDGITRTLRGVPPGYTRGRIERIDSVSGAMTLLYDSCDGVPLRGPNDIVFDAEGGFYFTDLGKMRERDRDHGGVYYAKADGSLIREIIFPISMPNGIGLSPDGRTLYVAETETARLWAFDLDGPGRIRKLPFPSPNGGRLVCGLGGFQRFDSLAVDRAGNICIATLTSGCISVISPDGRVRQIAMPDPMPTNICFGGPDLMTAYVTLSGTGKIASFAWPEGGLPLNYQGSSQPA
jgi:gluconolactonase